MKTAHEAVEKPLCQRVNLKLFLCVDDPNFCYVDEEKYHVYWDFVLVWPKEAEVSRPLEYFIKLTKENSPCVLGRSSTLSQRSYIEGRGTQHLILYRHNWYNQITLIFASNVENMSPFIP